AAGGRGGAQQPGGHVASAESACVPEGRMGAAHAAGAGGDGEILGGDTRLLSAISGRERLDGGFPEGDGGEFGAGSGVVFRAVAVSRGIAGGGGRVAVRCDGEARGGRTGTDAG